MEPAAVSWWRVWPASPGLLWVELVMTVLVGMGVGCCEGRKEPDMEDSMLVGVGCGCWGCGSGVVISDGALGYRFPIS